MGDDTPALQAVLDADVWRKHLLQEQDVSFGFDPYPEATTAGYG